MYLFLVIIADGCEHIHLKEKINFLSIAKDSLGKLKTQIVIGSRIGYTPLDYTKQLKR
ncbi:MULTISPECIES: four helix bundle protein [unclassified Pseudoalteromonas]|uniref:four helix bundle protein n=1 Tax=unclassified Pseudoalteromonas TaxID=194690 RepID=UPI001F52855F|nr:MULTISPECIES: four helix bundle protein [unclassified Pseudoalteromonas]